MNFAVAFLAYFSNIMATVGSVEYQLIGLPDSIPLPKCSSNRGRPCAYRKKGWGSVRDKYAIELELGGRSPINSYSSYQPTPDIKNVPSYRHPVASRLRLSCSESDEENPKSFQMRTTMMTAIVVLVAVMCALEAIVLTMIPLLSIIKKFAGLNNLLEVMIVLALVGFLVLVSTFCCLVVIAMLEMAVLLTVMFLTTVLLLIESIEASSGSLIMVLAVAEMLAMQGALAVLSAMVAVETIIMLSAIVFLGMAAILGVCCFPAVLIFVAIAILHEAHVLAAITFVLASFLFRF